MGCSNSKVDNEEPVRRCKDRRQLMKQLVRRRPELAAAHIAYLHALRNTGATLRDFAELESALSQQPPVGLAVPPSPHPPPPPPPEPSMTSSMPPSPRPPPPLPFSPIATVRKMEKMNDELPPPSLAFSPPGIRIKKMEKRDDELLPPPLAFSPPRIRMRKMQNRDDELHGNDSMDEYDDDTDSCSTPLPPPPPPGVAWEDLDPYNSLNFPSPFADRNDKEVGSQVTMDDDPWVETNLEFDGEEDESVLGNDDSVVNKVQMNPAKSRVLGDDNSSMVSWVTKDPDSTEVPWRNKKSLIQIVKEIDEYFLKAAASGSDVVILLDSAGGRTDALEIETKKGNIYQCTAIIYLFLRCSFCCILLFFLDGVSTLLEKSTNHKAK